MWLNHRFTLAQLELAICFNFVTTSDNRHIFNLDTNQFDAATFLFDSY